MGHRDNKELEQQQQQQQQQQQLQLQKRESLMKTSTYCFITYVKSSIKCVSTEPMAAIHCQHEVNKDKKKRTHVLTKFVDHSWKYIGYDDI